MNDRFDLEEYINRTWCIVDELKVLDELIFEKKLNQSDFSKFVLAIADSYDIKFNKLWDIYTNIVKEDYHQMADLREENETLRREVEILQEKNRKMVNARKKKKDE